MNDMDTLANSGFLPLVPTQKTLAPITTIERAAKDRYDSSNNVITTAIRKKPTLKLKEPKEFIGEEEDNIVVKEGAEALFKETYLTTLTTGSRAKLQRDDVPLLTSSHLGLYDSASASYSLILRLLLPQLGSHTLTHFGGCISICCPNLSNPICSS